VTAPDGSPAAHVPVYLLDFGIIRPLIDPGKNAYTDENGIILFEDVVPATYQLEVQGNDHLPGYRGELVVRPGRGVVQEVVQLSD